MNSFNSIFDENSDEYDETPFEGINNVDFSYVANHCSVGDLGWRSLRNSVPSANESTEGLHFDVRFKLKLVCAIIYSIYSVLYLITASIRYWPDFDTSERIIYLFFATIIIISPHLSTILCRTNKSTWHTLIVFLSSTLYFLSVVSVEHLINRQQYLAVLVNTWVYYNVLVLDSYEAITGTIVYTLSLDTYINDDKEYFFSSRLLIWYSLFFASALSFIKQRVIKRMLNHTKALIYFDRKHQEQIKLGNSIVAAYLPKDIYVDICKQNEDESKAEKQGPSIQSSCIYPESRPIIEAAILQGIITKFDPGFISLNDLQQKLTLLQRKGSAIITIKTITEESNECILQKLGEHEIHDILDIIASHYKITCVRKFGSVWVGVLGFFSKNLTISNSCKESIHFCSDVISVANTHKWSLTCAITHGPIIGGFLGNHANFNVLGSEVRMALNMVENNFSGELLVSAAVRQAVQRRPKGKGTDVEMTFRKKKLQSSGNSADFYVVENILELCKQSQKTIMDNYTSICKARRCIDWYHFQNLHDSNSTPSQSSPTTNSPSVFAQKATSRLTFYDKVIDLITTKCQELGSEFSSSIDERYNCSLDDSFMRSISDDELNKCQVKVLMQVHNIFWNLCLNSFSRKMMVFPRFVTYTTCDDNPKQLMSESINFGGISLDMHNYVNPFSSILHQISSFISGLFCENTFAVFSTNKCSDIIKAVANVVSGKGKFTLSMQKYSVAVTCDDHDMLDEKIMSSQVSELYSPSGEQKDHQSPSSTVIAIKRSRFTKASSINSHRSQLDQGSHVTFKQTATEINEKLESMSIKDNSMSNFSLDFPDKSPLIRRGFSKYCADLKLVSHHVIMLHGIYIIASVCSFTGLASIAENLSNDWLQILITCTLAVSDILPTFLMERRFLHTQTSSRICNIFRVVSISLIPLDLFCFNSVAKNGDLGGDVFFILLASCWVATSWSYSMSQLSLDLAVAFVCLFIRAFLNLSITPISVCAQNITCIVSLALGGAIGSGSYLWAFAYFAGIAYITEHVLLPAAYKNFMAQSLNTKKIMQHFITGVPAKMAGSIYRPRRYSKGTIVSIHIKAADLVPGLVEQVDVSRILLPIFSIIDTAINECGLIKVSEFSGVYLAVACKGSEIDSINQSYSMLISHVARSILTVRTIQEKIFAFNRRHLVHISLSIGLNQGSFYMGLLGTSRFAFDFTGEARNVSFSMASGQQEGVMLSNVFASDIFKDDIMHGQPDTLMIGNKSIWIFRLLPSNEKVDFYNGLELADFEYVCMLGKGGYGSVHLLRDKTSSGREYAIKSIPRNENSSNPKMIQREFSTLQQMNHPNVVNFKYCLVLKSRIFLFLDYIKGGNLQQVSESLSLQSVSNPNLRNEVLQAWFAELVLALDYVHGLGIIHRDVKPANIMIDTDGHLKLCDFGLSKIMSSHSRMESSRVELEKVIRDINVDKDVISLMRKTFPAKPSVSDVRMSKSQGRPRILLIGSDETKNILGQMGFNVLKARSVSDGLSIVSNFVVATTDILLILLDFEGEQDDLSIINKFSSHEVPVILLSTRDDGEFHSDVLARGAKELIIKPMSFHYHAILSRHVQAFRQRRDMSYSTSPSTSAQDELTEGSSDKNASIKAGGNIKISSILADTNTPLTISNPNKEQIRRRSKAVKMISDLQDSQEQSAAVGTPNFMAPELLVKMKGKLKYDEAIDWWACGVTFYECWTDTRLFQGKEKEIVFEKIRKNEYDLSLLKSQPELQDLVSKFLDKTSTSRLGSDGVNAIMEHAFFKAIDWKTVSTCLCKYTPQHHYSQPNQSSKVNFNKELFYGDDDPKAIRDKNDSLSNNSSRGGKYDKLSNKREKDSRKITGSSLPFSGNSTSSRSRRVSGSKHSSLKRSVQPDKSMGSITESQQEDERSSSISESEKALMSSKLFQSENQDSSDLPTSTMMSL